MINEELDIRYFPLIFDNIPYAIFTIDGSGRITAFNRMAEELTGYTRQEALGKQCYRIFRADICELDCPLKRSIRTGKRIEDREVEIITSEGRRSWIAISTAALLDDEGHVIGGVEMFRDLSVIKELRRKLKSKYVLEDIISKNPKMQDIFNMLPLLAASSSTVLIEGQSGTGKELVARAIHNLGLRRDKPFVPVNCAAIPENLVESELFGYEKGAFTDAKQSKPGRFAMADGGTLFLDEISELSMPAQVKLLRVLQNKSYEPLGSVRSTKADVRIIAATNRDLNKEVERNNFRQDLYYRLNVVKLTIPPLSERIEDIPLLVEHFINHFNNLEGRRIRRCSERVMAALMRYHWPGNVRELENAIEHAFVVCIGDTIQLEDLPQHIIEAALKEQDDSASKNPFSHAEAQIIQEALKRNNWHRQKTADELGISRNTLWRKMKKFGID